NQDCRDGADQDFEIEPEGPVVDVFEVQPDPVAEIAHLVASAYLPEAGQTRLHTQAAAMGEIIEALDFIHGQRAGPHQAHLALEHVPKLRPFVEALASQE